MTRLFHVSLYLGFLLLLVGGLLRVWSASFHNLSTSGGFEATNSSYLMTLFYISDGTSQWALPPNGLRPPLLTDCEHLYPSGDRGLPAQLCSLSVALPSGGFIRVFNVVYSFITLNKQ